MKGAVDGRGAVATIDDADVEVRVCLTCGPFRAVSLDVSLGDCKREVALETVTMEGLDAAVRVCSVGNAVKREQCVASDLLDEDDERVRVGGRRFDQRRASA